MELILHRHLGDNRMLVAGGLLDQPATMWFSVQFAGWLAALLEKQSNENTKPDQFNETETEYLLEVIQPLRIEVQQNNV